MMDPRSLESSAFMPSQLTQLQVKMGPSEWALKPDPARQEYDDVSPPRPGPF